MWDAQVAALEPDHRLLRYDLRGHGSSAAIARPFDPLEDLRSVLDAAGFDRSALVGLSSGAQVVLDFALVYPDRVTKLILAAPSVSGYLPIGSMEWMEPMVEALRSGDMDVAVERWAETPLMAIPGNESAAAAMREMTRDNAAIWTMSPALQQPLDPPALTRLAAATHPMLVIVGENDVLDSQRVADTLITCVVGARRLVVEGAGHLVNLAAPRVFNEAMLEFLAEDSVVAPETASPCVL
jgi:pimeloyl-ACP methyl ester carboxylesterase